MRTLPFRRHRLNKEDSIELIFCAAVLLLYVSNRWFGAWDSILPDWFLKNHFGDVCGGMLFPAYANLLLSAVGAKFRVDGFFVDGRDRCALLCRVGNNRSDDSRVLDS